jgi:anti-sigma-K factor RskA
MSTDAHLVELLPAYALDCLDDEDRARVAEHLSRCTACQAELLAYEGIARQLALAAPDAVPPHRVKAQIMNRVQPASAAARVRPRALWWQQLVSGFRRATYAWGVVGWVLIMALAIVNIWLWQRVDKLEHPGTAGSMEVIAMIGTDLAPQASGTLVVSADGEYGTLVVDGLPALDDEHQYQLWLIRGSQRASGGIFSVNAEGYGSLSVSSPEPLSTYPAFGVTVEPAGGSPGPTGGKLLGTQP